MKFPKGTILHWKKDNTPAYEKLSDDDWSWWVSLDSNYLNEVIKETTVYVSKDKIQPDIEDLTVDDDQIDLTKYTKKIVKEKTHELLPESEKPLYKKNGDLNRFGFRWTDNQVWEEYSNYMLFEFKTSITIFWKFNVTYKVYWSNNKSLKRYKGISKCYSGFCYRLKPVSIQFNNFNIFSYKS